ncbi:aromatic ring-hydroxylating dioxygenase subunit alpha [Pokkaliibacter plantistimulans]|nr:aromatic ring-hydroxylating dioxygenase subunit alpha [Pokkaliibacter plantistimulans]
MTVAMYQPQSLASEPTPFPLDQWYVAAHAWEVTQQPLARTLLSHPVVMFRTAAGEVAALEDRCCHRALPLSRGTVEADGIRCGYHGLLFDQQGSCVDIPGQLKIPAKARVRSYVVCEQDDLVWMWFGRDAGAAPAHQPPRYDVHSSGKYLYKGDVYHYDAPYQLIHDNLLDLSHLGYVHLHTIGGDARTHMNARMTVEEQGETVTVKRHMLDSVPPPTYVAAYPFREKVDRWQEIEFRVTHLRIWTGAVDAGSESVDDPDRGGFHMRGFHGVTPETATTSHYFWTIATNPKENLQETLQKVVEQTKFTFDEDKVVIEAQYNNICQFDHPSMIDIHVDIGANRARRMIQRLCMKE